jgi:hypothetical protein
MNICLKEKEIKEKKREKKKEKRKRKPFPLARAESGASFPPLSRAPTLLPPSWPTRPISLASRSPLTARPHPSAAPALPSL